MTMQQSHQRSTKWFLLLSMVLGVSCAQQPAAAQAVGPTKLTRADVVVKKDLPMIGICVDPERNKKQRIAELKTVWLRIFNNTVWSIEFISRGGGNKDVLVLADGRHVPALAEGSVTAPMYDLESREDFRRMETGLGHTGTFSWLPSGTSSVFEVPASDLLKHLLFVDILYEWELREGESYTVTSPKHRVYFSLNDPSDILKDKCLS